MFGTEHNLAWRENILLSSGRPEDIHGFAHEKIMFNEVCTVTHFRQA